MRKNMNLISESLRTNKIHIPYLIILSLLLIMIGFCIVELAYIWSWTKVLSILAGGLIIVIALFRVEFSIALLMVVMMDIFGFIDVETFLRIPGVFKFKDVIFIILSVRMAADLIINRESIGRLRSSTTRPILFFLACTALVIFLTAIFRHTSVIFSLGTGRMFFYYSIFFLVLYYVREEKQLSFLLKACFVFSFIVAFLLIAQFIVGQNLLFVPYTRIMVQRAGLYKTLRVYHPRGIPILLLGFLCSVGILYHKSGNHLFWSIVTVSFLGLGILLQLYRTIWAVAIIGVIFSWFIVQRKYKVRFFRLGVPLIGIILLLGMLIISLYTIPKVLFIKARFLSIFQDFFGVKGNYARNLAVAVERLQYIKSNPIWGIGFIHPLDPFSQQLIRQSVYNIDNSWVTILSYMGALGVLSMFWLSVVFMKRTLFILRNIKDSFYKGVLVGFIGFYIACLVSLLYISPFVYGEGIATIALMIGLSEAIFRIKVQKTHRC